MKLYLQIALLFGLFLFQGSLAQNSPKLTSSSATSSEEQSDLHRQHAAKPEETAETKSDNGENLKLVIRATDLETVKEEEEEEEEEEKEEKEKAKKRARLALDTVDKILQEAEVMRKELEQKLLDATKQARIAKAALEATNIIQKDAEKGNQNANPQTTAPKSEKIALEAAKIELEVEKAIAKRNFRRAVQLVRTNESLVDVKKLLDHIDQEQKDFDSRIIWALDKLRSRPFSRAYRIPSGSLDANFFFGNMCESWDLQERDFLTAWILLRRYSRYGCAVSWQEGILGSGAEGLTINGYALFLLNHYQDGIDDDAVAPIHSILDQLEAETRLIIDRFTGKENRTSFGNSDFGIKIEQLLINLAALWLLANGEEIEDGLDLPGIEKAIKKALEKGKCRHPRRREEAATQPVVERAVLKIPGMANETQKESENSSEKTAKPIVDPFVSAV